MAFSTDYDLVALAPDILDMGIKSFALEHAKAEADIKRDLEAKWWPSKSIAGAMDPTLLTDAQFTRCSAYLVLWRYALPKLTNWVDGDRFQNMIEFYQNRYNEEFAAILAAGVEYDANNDSVIDVDESATVGAGYLVR